MCMENCKSAFDSLHRYYRNDSRCCGIRLQKIAKNIVHLQRHLPYVECYDFESIRKELSRGGIERRKMDSYWMKKQ